MKIWSYISLFLSGVIVGIIVFIKFLDNPDYQYEIKIKKLKSKNNTGKNSGVIPSIQIEEQRDEKKKKFKLFNKHSR